MRGFRRWLPPVAWMGAIYFLSTDYLSMPGVRQTWTGFLAAKATHVAEYAVLVLLWYRAAAGGLAFWRRRAATWAFLATAGYAMVDEYHQSTTLHRNGNAGDVTLDVVGMLVGLVVMRGLTRIREGREGESHEETGRGGEPRGHVTGGIGRTGRCIGVLLSTGRTSATAASFHEHRDELSSVKRLRRWLLNTAMVIGSLLLTLIVLEVGLRLFAPQPLNLYNFTLVNEPGIVGHTTGPHPTTFYRIETKPPGQGPMIPNTRQRLGSVDISVNAHGWRDRVYAPQVAPGTYRIAVVGDSVTLGYGVTLDETYHKRLEKRLNEAGVPLGKRFEVIAMAGGGGTTYDELRMVRRHLGYFKPKELWLAFNLNDILFPPYEVWGKEELDATSRTAPIAVSPTLRVRVMMLLGWLRVRSDALLRPHSHVYHLLRQRAKVLLRMVGIYTPSMQPEASFAFSSPQAQAPWAATRAAIVEIRDESARQGVQFGVLMLPADPQTSTATADWYRRQLHFVFDEDFATGVVQQRICVELTALVIKCLDPLPLFRARPDQPLFLRLYGDSVDWIHTNAAGHELLAEAMFADLQPRLLRDAPARPAGGRASSP